MLVRPAGNSGAGSELAFERPALDERWLTPGAGRELAEPWQRAGWLRVESVLAAGVAAQLAAMVTRMNFSPQLQSPPGLQCWRCTLRMPDAVEPQYPSCLYRIGRALQTELPRLISDIVGAPMAATQPSVIDLQVFRKGSYMEPHTGRGATGGVSFMIGLTGARWPAAWGGHLGIAGRGVEHHLPLGWNTLELFGDVTVQLPLVSRHVQGVVIAGTLIPA